jgi:nuclear pore complex protein Nup160
MRLFLPAVSYLWSNIFTHSIQNSNFDMAYLATISNPLLDRQEDCLRRILVVMAETGHLSEMMSFPFNGMVDQVASILRDKARRSDVTEQPNFYRILYSFHVTRGNYRQAAQIMYEYAERLTNGESSRTLVWLEDYVGALLSTVDALKMVDPNFAFIVIKHRKNVRLLFSFETIYMY